MATREAMKKEAVARMKNLGMFPQVVKEFEEDGVLEQSENGGYLYWLDDDAKEMGSRFERETGCLVYHVILSYTSIGKMYSLLYVCSEEEEWEMDREDLKEGIAIAHVINTTMDIEESGCIGIKPRIGGLVRTN